ncbi:MAG: AAA family ATPase [Bacteroidetes bacterium]|nr:AAA family ATPase [Bacteroidota bacterium]
MRIFLTGACCVGKTTIGKKMGKLLGIRFFDLDQEIESFFGTSIERLQNQFFTIQSFRNEAAKALVHLLNRPESRNSVISLTPSGLLGGYWKVMKKASGITVVLTDRPENIMERVRFYDIDSRLIEIEMTAEEKKLHLKDLKKDIIYFNTGYKRANLQVDISGLNPDQAACKVIEIVEEYNRKIQQEKSEQTVNKSL